MPKQKQNDFTHTPVLIQEVLGCLDPRAGQSYLDLTAGFGGHAGAVLDITNAPEQTVLIDRDQDAVTALNERFKGKGVKITQSDFLSTLRTLVSENQRFDMILADLGVSSLQLGKDERGFSFARSGPLDMRMDQSQTLSAEHIVNQADKNKLTQILSNFGEERRAEYVAMAIIQNRPISSTEQLATIITDAAGGRHRFGKINPATKSFQAIRIAVNQELEQLEQSLPLMVEVLKPAGRLAVISFHSLEDRIVKQFFAEQAANTYDAQLKLLTKKPISASRSEIVSNPRARSARLRAAAKIKTD